MSQKLSSELAKVVLAALPTPLLTFEIALNSSEKMIQVRNHHFEPAFDPMKKNVCNWGHLEVEHVPVMMST